MVRAKFKVDAINRTMGSRKSEKKNSDGRDIWEPAEIRSVVMSPVYGNGSNEENNKFWNATPTGRLELGCCNLEAAQHFELGKEYYIDFTPAN